MQYISTKDVARELGVSTCRVLQLIDTGRLKAEKLGRAWLILPRDLRAVRNRKPGRPPHKGKRHVAQA